MVSLYGGRAVWVWVILGPALSPLWLWFLRPSAMSVSDQLWPEAFGTLYYQESLYVIQLVFLLVLLMFATRHKQAPLQWMLLVSLMGRKSLILVGVLEWLCGCVTLIGLLWWMQGLRGLMTYDDGARLSLLSYGVVLCWYHYLFCVIIWAQKQRYAYAFLALIFIVFLASVTLHQGLKTPWPFGIRLLTYVMPSLQYTNQLEVFGSLWMMSAISFILTLWLVFHEQQKDYTIEV